MPTPTRNGDLCVRSVRDIPPYAASLRWYARWFGARLKGLDDNEAIGVANRQCGVHGKDYTRAAIGKASSPMMLSVAVEGGSAVLKRTGAERRATVSLHGRWPHTHLGALEASYGRAPYYQHVMPGIQEILGSVETSDSLSDLNRRIHGWLSGFIDTGLSYDPVGVGRSVALRGAEIYAGLDAELSVIDALMRYGPETTLALVSMVSEETAEG